jgi:DNA-binding LacI/PurR family transcriptional regulator
VRVPEDVSVVGFDDLPEAPYFRPALTTIRQDFGELGRRAMRVVARALAGEPQPAEEDVLPVLIPRASTAATTSSHRI